MIAIEVRNLVKRFGRVEALKGVSLTINVGEIFCVVGPNGAGKTTLFRIVSGLIKPTSGSVNVMGIDVVREPDRVKKLIAYLPEDANTYDRLTGWENLLFYAKMVARSDDEAREMVEWAAEISGLGDALRRKTSTYSRGMKRRLLVARTLMLRRPITILDEPTAGLDVFAAYEVRQLLKEMSRAINTTLLLSTHNLHEAEAVCDRVALLYQGVKLCEGRPSEIVEALGARNLEEAFIKLVRGSS